MRILFTAAAVLMLATVSARAGEMDKETKGKVATTPQATLSVSGSELDSESPDQSGHYHYRGGYGGYRSFNYGYSGYRGYNYGYSSYRPYYSYSYSYPSYNYGYSYYRPSYSYYGSNWCY